MPQQQQDTDDKFPVVKLRRIDPEEVAPRGEELSFKGFGANLLTDAWDVIKGIGQAVIFAWPRAVKAGYDILSDPEGMAMLWSSPEHLTHELKETGKAVVNAIIDPYVQHPTTFWYHRPIGTLADILTIWDLGAGSVAKIGRLAGGESKVARALAEATGKPVRALTSADKIVQMADDIRELPRQIGRKGVERFMRVFGIDAPARRLTLGYSGRREAQALDEAAKDLKRHTVEAFALKPEEHGIFDQMLERGYTHAEAQRYPRVAAAIEAYRPLAAHWQTVFIKHGVLDGATADERLVKGAAFSIYKKITAETKAAARAHIEKMPFKPVYRPHVFDKLPYGDELADVFHDLTAGKASRLEAFKGMPGFVTDPRVWMTRAIRDFRKIEGRIDYINDILKDPRLALEATSSAGHLTVDNLQTYGIFKKYFENVKSKAQAVYMRDLGKRAGGWEKADALLKTDPNIMEEFNAVQGVRLNPTTMKILGNQFYRPGGAIGSFLEKYDKLLNYFRWSATQLNPKWHLVKAIGSGLLGLEAATSFRSIGKAHAFMDAVPPSLKHVGYIGEDAQFLGRFGEKINDSLRFSEGIHESIRSGVFTKKLGEEMEAAGLSGFETATVADQVMRDTMLSQPELMKLRVDMQLAAESLSARQPTIQRAASKLKRADERALRVERKAGAVQHQIAMEAMQKGVPISSLPAETQKRYGRVNRLIEDARGRRVIAEAEHEQLAAGARAEAMHLDMMEGRLPELSIKAKMVEHAEDFANTFFSNVLFLGPIERQWLRRIVPFYTWMRSITSLAFKIPFLRPKTRFMFSRYASVMQSLVGDPELPDYMAPYFPVLARQDGSTVWVRLGGLVHAGALRTDHIGGIPVPGIFAIWRENPFLSLGYRMVGGRDEFTMSPVPPGEPMVSMGDGTVYEFTEDGKLRRTIPQAPAISSIMHMFPQVQIAETLFAPYEVAGHNWVGYPKPILNPDGTYRYPRELWQRIAAAFVVPVKERKREDIISAEKRQVAAAMRDLVKRYRRAFDPDERKMIEQTLRDYREGAFRRIEARH